MTTWATGIQPTVSPGATPHFTAAMAVAACAVSVAVGLVAAFQPTMALTTFLWACLTVPMGVFTNRRFGRNAALIFLVAAFFRTILALTTAFIDVRAVAPDTANYYSSALSLATHWKTGSFYFPIIRNGHTFTLATLFWTLGDSPIGVTVVTAVLSTAVVVVTIALANSVGVAPLLAAFIVGFLPEFVMWSSLMLKDGLIYVMTYALLTLGMGIIERGVWAKLPLFVLISTALYFYRAYQLAEVLVTFAVVYILVETFAHRRFFLGAVAAGVLLGLTILVLGKLASLQMLLESRQMFSSGNTALLGAGTGPSSGSILHGLLTLAFYPLPWQTSGRSLFNLVAALLSPLWDLLFLGGLWGCAKAIRRGSFTERVLAVYVLLVVCLYSFVIVNAGALYRHRMELVPALAVLAVGAFQQASAGHPKNPGAAKAYFTTGKGLA